jgi:transcription termination factor Rho
MEFYVFHTNLAPYFMTQSVSGIFQSLARGGGFLRDPLRSFQPGPDDPAVPPELIRAHGLVDGASVSGSVRPAGKGVQLATVETICGLPPAQFQERKRFDQLVAVDPTERFRLGMLAMSQCASSS